MTIFHGALMAQNGAISWRSHGAVMAQIALETGCEGPVCVVRHSPSFAGGNGEQNDATGSGPKHFHGALHGAVMAQIHGADHGAWSGIGNGYSVPERARGIAA